MVLCNQSHRACAGESRKKKEEKKEKKLRKRKYERSKRRKDEPNCHISTSSIFGLSQMTRVVYQFQKSRESYNVCATESFTLGFEEVLFNRRSVVLQIKTQFWRLPVSKQLP